MKKPLHELSIAECSRELASGAVSPVELTEACLGVIETHDPDVNAFLDVTADLARAQARAAEEEIHRIGLRSPMHGVPFALKDIYDTRGIATTGHSALYKQRIPAEDSACTERLYSAGAVLLGKLATHEFATGGPAYDLPWPPASNPWLLDRFPGGSSSGSGAAVASGMVPGALGSDTAGSIRLPAAFCGVAGLKPTYGRVSKRGVLPLSWTLDTCGPLTWTVEDAAIMLQIIAGHDPLDPCTVQRCVPDYTAALREDLKGMRIGIVRHFYEKDSPADAVTVAAMEDAVKVLQGLGATLVDVVLPPLADYQAATRIIIVSEAFAIHRENLLSKPELYSAVTRYRIMPGALVAAADYSNALRFQRVLADKTLYAMSSVDALLTATTHGPAPVQSQMRAEANFSRPPLTGPFNAAQLPTLSICNGYAPEGLPLAMQVVGRPFDEATVLHIGHAYECATNWRDRRPAFEHPENYLDAVAPGAKIEAVDPRVFQDCQARIESQGMQLDELQLADLTEAMPHLEAMIARIPKDLGFTAVPSSVFGW
ncbi:MAG: Asp-tRNA(Asn)/Glu-tRNA(Gln) amidotransferase GatCAB subunit A [Rhodospirillaceae bacterium]|nr:Asp-tRNA(Asn)/Glu-tRNA(Gln) amidotransferase GatCAB subunit A [Rhodospirillaceae bacterium]